MNNPTFIPLHLTGGMGDVILAIDAIKRLQKDFQLLIYTKHKEAFQYFYPSPVFEIIPDYAWKLEFDTIAQFVLSDSFDGFLLEEHKKLFEAQKILFSDIRKYYLIAQYGKEHGWNRRTFPLRCLGYSDEPELELMPKKESSDYITIHDGFDVNSSHLISGERSTKQWKLEHLERLAEFLHKAYPEKRIIQLGSKTGRPIKGVDECLLNKTTITEAFDILSKSCLHIDGDSGLVHAATRMQVPCVVLWGPTPEHFYGYPQNINLRSSVCADACYGKKEDWMDKCPLGYDSPKCMDEISPERVIAEIKRAHHF